MFKLNIAIFFWGRLFVEKFLCVLGLSNLQEIIKKLLLRHDRFISDNFIENRIDSKLSELAPYFLSYDVKNVYEQGTGWHGIDIIVLYLLGAEKIFTTDIRDLLLIAHLRKVTKFLNSNINKYELYKDKIQILNDNVEKDRDAFLNAINTRYFVNDDFSYGAQVKNHDRIYYDMFYSDSVLQRFKVNDLRKFLDNSLSLSNTGAFHLHKIDSKDFFSINNKKLPPMYYLSVNQKFYEMLTCYELNYQNRLRIFEFIDIFNTYFVFVKTLNEISSSDDIDFVIKNDITKIYSCSYTSSEIAIKKFDIISSC